MKTLQWRLLTALLSLVFGVAAGGRYGVETLPVQQAAAPTAWLLPDHSRVRVTEQTISQLGQLQPWGRKPQAGVSPGGQWMLKATVLEGRQWFALLQSHAGTESRPKRYAPGSQLPDGAQLLSVTAETAVIAVSGQQNTLKLFRPQPLPETTDKN